LNFGLYIVTEYSHFSTTRHTTKGACMQSPYRSIRRVRGSIFATDDISACNCEIDQFLATYFNIRRSIDQLAKDWRDGC